MRLRLVKWIFVTALVTAYGLLVTPIALNQLDEEFPYPVLGSLVTFGCHVMLWILPAYIVIKVATRKRQDAVFDWRLDVLVVGLVIVALAAPGMLEDRQSTKLARVRLMMRELAWSVEVYQDMAGELPTSFDQLETYPSTAIGEEALRDPYSPEWRDFGWVILDATNGAIISVGPDGVSNAMNGVARLVYDPTNGTKSPGDLIRSVNRRP
jgi:hypothetical protein